jgi:hypothetical protein
MIDALIKRVSVTYKCYEMYAHRGKRCNCSCFEIDQEMDAILLIIGIAYGVCRIVIKSVQQCNRNYSAILATLQITSYVHSRNSS